MQRQSKYELLWEVDDDGDIRITDTTFNGDTRVTEDNFVPLTKDDLIEMLSYLGDGTRPTIIGG